MKDETLDYIYRFLQIINQPKTLERELINGGWYPIRLIGRVEKDKSESIDHFMERVLCGRFYIQIKHNYCYEQYPERKHILEEAFKLFEEERYFSCIPLFLSQIDGISKDFGVKGMFQGKNEKEIGGNHKKEEFSFFSYVIKHTENNSLIKSNVLKFLYSPLYLSRGASNLTSINTNTNHINPDQTSYLNRHAILHGYLEFINYGSRINALKVINLLIFVINMIADLDDIEN